MPDFCPPSIREFQTLIVGSRTPPFFGLPERASQPASDPGGRPYVTRDDFWATSPPRVSFFNFPERVSLHKQQTTADGRVRFCFRVRFSFREPPIYTCVRMLENTPRTAIYCHISRFATGNPRRDVRSVSLTGAGGWDTRGGFFSDLKTSWQYTAQNCHSETGALFTMSGDRTEGGGRRAEDGGERVCESRSCAEGSSPRPSPGWRGSDESSCRIPQQVLDLVVR
jgi:hypothetical protein